MIFEAVSGTHHAKASCYLCGRTDSLANTEVQIEGEGILAICRVCVTDAALVLGLTFNETAVSELRAELQRVTRERDDALEIRSALQEAIDKAATPRPRARK